MSNTDWWVVRVFLQELFPLWVLGEGPGSHVTYTSPIKDQVPLDRTAASLLSALELCEILTTELTVD